MLPTSRSSLGLRLAVVLAALSLAGGLSGCGGGGGSPGFIDPSDPVGTCGGGGGPPVTITGRVLYERLVLSAAGLGPATETRPARHVDVEVRSAASGSCYGRTSTNALGDYTLTVQPPEGAAVEVVAFSRTLEAPGHDIVIHDALPPFSNTHSETNVFRHASAAFVAASTTVNFTVPYRRGALDRPSVGFGLLDIFVTCWDTLAAANATPPERAHGYTRVGNNGSLGTSYYNQATRSVAILGGASGLVDDSDTDYFDDGVAAHEFHHFVDSVISYSMSRGGAHGGELLEPNFAWSEGAATGFACLMLGTPAYIDTSKTDSTKSGTIVFNTSAENTISPDPAGIGDEFSVAEVVWDLGDGANDADTDGINASLTDLYAALKSFDPMVDGPYLGLFLQRVEAISGAVSQSAMTDFLVNGPENQQVSYPPAGEDIWPKPITLGGSGSGTLTGLVPNPSRALAASHWYQFTLAGPAVVQIRLMITPIAGSPNNLDIVLAANQLINYPIASSKNFGDSSEIINASLGAGTYILRVEANSIGGNHASYDLTID